MHTRKLQKYASQVAGSRLLSYTPPLVLTK